MFATIPPRRLMFLAAAMLLSLVAALTVRGWVEHVRSEAKPAVVQQVEVAPPKMVLVAAKPLPAGHFIKADDFAWQSWPDQNVSASYLLQDKTNVDTLVGSVVKSGIAAGEPVTMQRIVKKGDRGFLAAIVQPGFRAITVNVQANTGLSGLAIPGDRIDLILTMDVPGTAKDEPAHKVSETVLQDIRVLAVDQKMDDQSSDAVMARTTTLEVTPKQAEVVSLLTEMGRLGMTLRSIGSAENDAQSHAPTMTWDSDATDIGSRRNTNNAGASNRVDVVRGNTHSSVDFSTGSAVTTNDERLPAAATTGGAAPITSSSPAPVIAPVARPGSPVGAAGSGRAMPNVGSVK